VWRNDAAVGQQPTGSTPLGGDVHLIDTRMYGYEGITGAYLILSGRPCLVETGPALSAPLISTALCDLGVGSYALMGWSSLSGGGGHHLTPSNESG
jgi:hypothetical protein